VRVERRAIIVGLGRALTLTALLLAMGSGAHAAGRDTAVKAGERYASLRANEVNVRAGPGVRYPVKWKFVQRYMPVQVIAEFDTWRKIRDWEGAEGWVHRAMLSGKRSLIIVGRSRTMRRHADESAPAVARLAPGMVAVVIKCPNDWCKIEAQGYEGWIRRAGVWGLKPNERVR
jgi:SH3-like domain-containing protein